MGVYPLWLAPWFESFLVAIPDPPDPVISAAAGILNCDGIGNSLGIRSGWHPGCSRYYGAAANGAARLALLFLEIGPVRFGLANVHRFFGLQKLPFNLTLTSVSFLPSKYREALAGLTYAVLERKGFVVLTGDAGTGKRR